MKQFVTLLICLVFPTFLLASIHGDDDRYEAYEIFDNLEFTMYNADKLTQLDEVMVVESMRATAAMMYHTKIVEDRGFYTVVGSPLSNYVFYSTAKPLCSGVRYLDQVASASCSGVLISPKHILTAGHCVVSKSDCDNYKWIFDYKYHDGSDEILLSENEIYKCSSIVDRKFDTSRNIDYAVVELDREVVGRTPLKTRTKGNEKYFVKTVDSKTGEEILKQKISRVKRGDPLFLVGFPYGTPMKVTTNGKIIDKGLANAIRSNLDNFMGNSGGPVINATTGIVEGVISIVSGRGLVDGPVEADGTKCLVPRELSDIPTTSTKGLFIQSTRTNQGDLLEVIRGLL